MHYLDPKNDLTFKRIFGEHPHLCKSFLNSVLPLEPDALIEELEYLSPELVPEIPVLKRTIVDVRCRDQKGRQFIVEMQMHWTESFKNRVVFNASKAYVKQLDNAREYKLLHPVYALSLVNENFEPKLTDYYHHYKIVNISQPERQIEGLQFIFIELPKFKAANLQEKRLQVLWLKFLTEIEDGANNIPPELLEEAHIKEAVHILESGSYSKAQLEHYDQYWDSIRSERSLFLDAEERGRVEGEHTGFVKGEQIGMQRGEQIGMQKGEQKGLRKGVYLSALKLMENGMSPTDVARMLAITPEEMKHLTDLHHRFGDNAHLHLDDAE